MAKKLLGIVMMAAALAGADWPGWRGPKRDGSLGAPLAVKAWPERLNRRWKITVGEGYSSPIYAGGRIFLITRQRDQEVVRSIDPDSGKVVWEQSYAASYTLNSAAAAHGPGPKSTPVFAQGKLCTLGISGILACFDATNGRLLWRNDFKSQFKRTSPDFGTAMSPLIDSGRVIAHVGGSGEGAFAAFDVASGEMKWSWRGDGPAYASPIIVNLAGGRQMITQTQQNIVGINPANGELLWKMPYTTQFTQNIVTPMLYKDTLIFGGLGNPTIGVRVSKTEKSWSTERVWGNDKVPMYMSSPVLSGDLLFGFSHRSKGQFFCLDLRDGSMRWSSDGRQGDNAALVVGGDTLYLLKDDAELIVARVNGNSFEQIRRYTVADSSTYAHPLITEKGIVVKDAGSLALWTIE